MISLNEDDIEIEEIRVLTKQEEIALLKARGREQTDPVQKLYAIYDQVAAIISLIDDTEFRENIGTKLQRLDLNPSKAQNWIDTGRDPKDFYLVSCHNRLNDALMILAEVENRAISEGVVPSVTVEGLEQQLEMEKLRQEITKLQASGPEDGEEKAK